MIYHLIYVSSARKPFDRPALDALLAQAREANARAGITGMLAYCGGNFMQLLEGQRKSVEDIFDRIARDPRHFDVTTLVDLETPERWCGNWSMAYAASADTDTIDSFTNLTARQDQILSSLGDDHIARRIIRGFIEGNR